MWYTTRALARIFHEYLIRKHISDLLCNQCVALLEISVLIKASSWSPPSGASVFQVFPAFMKGVLARSVWLLPDSLKPSQIIPDTGNSSTSEKPPVEPLPQPLMPISSTSAESFPPGPSPVPYLPTHCVAIAPSEHVPLQLTKLETDLPKIACNSSGLQIIPIGNEHLKLALPHFWLKREF